MCIRDSCVTDLVPSVLEPGPEGSMVVGDEVVDAAAVVVLVLDGFGWHQLERHARLAPTLAGLTGGPVTTVAPSTTAAALTSIVTGTAPGEHGIVGYRIDIDGEVLNVLRWSTPAGDARERIPPEEFQTVPAFLGHRPVVVQNAQFTRSGFSRAHLAGVRHRGWRTLPTLAVEVRQAVAAGEPFVYAYYDGVDKIAHEFGFGEHYEAEVVACERLVTDLMTALPRGTALVVTADHGIVDCTDGETPLDPAVVSLLDRQSGEARFRWLHAAPGRARDLAETAEELHGDRAWVRTVDSMLEAGWFGPVVTETARARMGDVALVARDHWAFTDAADTGRIRLIGRHGSLTAEEMLVPMLSFVS